MRSHCQSTETLLLPSGRSLCRQIAGRTQMVVARGSVTVHDAPIVVDGAMIAARHTVHEGGTYAFIQRGSITVVAARDAQLLWLASPGVTAWCRQAATGVAHFFVRCLALVRRAA